MSIVGEVDKPGVQTVPWVLNRSSRHQRWKPVENNRGQSLIGYGPVCYFSKKKQLVPVEVRKRKNKDKAFMSRGRERCRLHGLCNTKRLLEKGLGRGYNVLQNQHLHYGFLCPALCARSLQSNGPFSTLWASERNCNLHPDPVSGNSVLHQTSTAMSVDPR